jgi:hypothetical protein
MKKNWLLIVIAVVLATVYVVYFTDWFAPKTIQIFHTDRNLHRQMQRNVIGLPSLIFGVNHPLKFNEIKVVPLAGFQTNRDILPLWHLVSDSNSVPVKSFYYGQPIRGMKPAVQGSRPQPLETNITYRLIVTSGKFKGDHDFELK